MRVYTWLASVSILWIMTSLALILVTVSCPPEVQAEGPPLTLAVLDMQGKDVTTRKWAPLSQYLSDATGREYRFVTIQNSGLIKRATGFDFVLTNPVSAVAVHETCGYEIIATLNQNKLGPKLGGVIITHRDYGFRDVRDLAGKNIGVIDLKTAAGGYLFQAYELVEKGLEPSRDFRNFKVIPNQRRIVRLVSMKHLDAGFIRTGMIEEINGDKADIDTSKLVIMNLQPQKEPFPSSTPMYPHWGFLAASSVKGDMVQAVRKALFNLTPGNGVCVKAGIKGFVEPVDYEKIVQIMKTLKVPPFDKQKN